LSTADKRQLAKILLIQMRYPDLYFELLKAAGTLDKIGKIQELTAIEEKKALQAADASFAALYANVDLRRFLMKTVAIQLSEKDVARWLDVTKGAAS
jgi:hypothetical protein